MTTTDSWTDDEVRQIEPYVSSTTSPVFALRNLPETTKAALFARYSRTPKSLRRLLLDEFLEEDASVAGGHTGSQRASDLFSRVIGEYGDDSVAQLGGVHLACEGASQILIKKLEWGRLMAYLEQSTRYVPFTDKPHGRYRYVRDPILENHPLGRDYISSLDALFDEYASSLGWVTAQLDATIAKSENAGARKRAIGALGLDICRTLLPTATVTNVGIYGNPQAFEQLVMRLRADPLPEAQRYADLIAHELEATIPDFVQRLGRPDRGGVWVDYLKDLADATKAYASVHEASPSDATSSVTLVDFDADGEQRIAAAALFPYSTQNGPELRTHIDSLSHEALDDLFRQITGERGNRRHRPGRAFEEARYTFEIVSDYGVFRDLQRHRMLTLQWQPLSASLGWVVPDEIANTPRFDAWRNVVQRAEETYAALRASDLKELAPYALTLGHRLRYTMTMNAREAMHMIELRTSPQGHRGYRAICQQMHDEISGTAHHERIAAAMRFVGHEDVHLPRYQSEARHEAPFATPSS